jgi:hypothetical protein
VPRSRSRVAGEQLAQVDNRDPFAAPVWRSPVYRTPEGVILAVQLLRVIWRVLWFVVTHPLIAAAAALAVVTWLGLSWPGLVALAVVVIAGLAGLRLIRPQWFTRFVTVPVLDWLRWVFYRRRWKAAMTLAGLAPDYRGQPMLPVLDRVRRAGAVDLVRVGLVTGQAPADFEARAENLAHAFGARLCRIRAPRPASWCWNWSALTLSPTRSPRCPSPAKWTWPGCPWAGARTARPGGCGWLPRTC